MDIRLEADELGIIRMPSLLKGELIFAPKLRIETIHAAFSAHPPNNEPLSLRIGDAFVIRQATVDRATLQPSGTNRYLAFPAPSADALLEKDLTSLTSELHRLPVSEVLNYVTGLRALLQRNEQVLLAAARQANAVLHASDRTLELVFQQLPEFLDADSLGEQIDRELAAEGLPGRTLLDHWIEVPARVHTGFTAGIRTALFGGEADRKSDFAAVARMKAVPTRQLHISAGNSPLIVMVSLLRAISTKGAAIIKCPHQSTLIGAVLASAMVELDAHHPITRHTSILYWPGGDEPLEDRLLSSSHIDRVVVWGSLETVASTRRRTSSAKIVSFNPRYGLSLIGNDALVNATHQTAVLAVSDALVDNQQACTSSLVHYVEGTEQEALAYCQHLQEVLKVWDRAMPSSIPQHVLGQLRALRRGAFLNGRWFINQTSSKIQSAVVYLDSPFDLQHHTMSRLIVVRRVDHLLDVVPYLSPSVSTVGIYPPERIDQLRDIVSASGVSNIFPLGTVENMYAGMPQDGMRVLSELVNWVNA